jgi:uncharacterized protein YfaS (alpha-2-macroglobulin family)
VGEEFLVRLRLRAVDKDYLGQIAVVDLLPGGVEPVINRVVLPTPEQAAEEASEESGEYAEGENDSEGGGEYAEGDGEGENTGNTEPAATVHFIPGFSGEPGQSTWQAEFADLRDDRVVVYGSLTKDMVTFTYRVRATNTGLYQTPAAYAEAMYQPNIFARTKASKFSVVKP